MIQKARIAVIGAGWWGSDYHIPGVLANPDAELIAICDTHPERLQKAAQVYQIRHTFTDYRRMLASLELDGAIIVTPHATHYAIARDCLEQDLHVLIEKPMTLFARDARDLVKLAEERDKEIVIGYPFHYAPQTLRARQVIQSGELGTIQYVTCSFASNVREFLSGGVSEENPPVRYSVQAPSENYNRPELLGGGQGHLQITHSAALMFFITGLRARRVHALMNRHGLALDLVDAMTVEFEGGALGMVGGTGNAGSCYRLALTVNCERGSLLSDSQAPASLICRQDGSREELQEQHPYREMKYIVTTNFVDLILGRAENGSPGEIGLKTVELLDAAYRSAQTDGQAVLIEHLYPA